MSQHDTVIDNAAGATVRSDINAALAAVFGNNSGASAPSVTLAYMWWADTSAGLLKVRNAANSAWVTVGTLASTNLGLLSLAGGTLTGALNEKGFTVAAHATTCDIWSGGNVGTLTGGAVTFTDVADAPVADAWRWVRSNAAHVLTNNANIAVQGNANLTLADGDMMLWHAITTTTFEVWIFKENGQAVVAPNSFITKLITDTTDIALAVRAVATQSNVGSSFSVDIPTSGFIRMSSFTGRFLSNAVATAHKAGFGIRIGSTNYWFGTISDFGTTRYLNQFYWGTVANDYFESNGTPSLSDNNVAADTANGNTPTMDIVAMGIPTGVQTVQLIAGYNDAQSTLKGTVKTTRVILEFVEV